MSFGITAWNRLTGVKGIRVFNTLKHTYEEWLYFRLVTGIGSSEISTVLGINPWESALGLWLKKVGFDDSEIEDNDAMYWGRVLEPVVAKEFATRFPAFRVQRVNSIIQHPEIKHHIASPDRILLPKPELDEDDSFPNYVAGTGMLEIKTVSKDVYQTHWKHGVPEYVYAQLQWQLHCSGTNWGAVALLSDKDNFRTWFLKKDEETLSKYIRKADDFWYQVQSGIQPPIDSHEQTQEALSLLYADHNREIIELPESAGEHFENYAFAMSKMVEMDAMKRLASNSLMNLVGENEKGILNGAFIQWTANRKGTRVPKIINPERAIA